MVLINSHGMEERSGSHNSRLKGLSAGVQEPPVQRPVRPSGVAEDSCCPTPCASRHILKRALGLLATQVMETPKDRRSPSVKLQSNDIRHLEGPFMYRGLGPKMEL